MAYLFHTTPSESVILFVKLDCNNVFFFVCLFNYVKNKNKKKKRKVKNNKTHPIWFLASVRVTFQDLRGKKWFLGI